MATVLAVDHDTVASVVDRARVHGPIAISNINAPTQHVIAGAEAGGDVGGDDARGRACRAHHDHRAPRADALADDGGRGATAFAPALAQARLAGAGARLLAECHRHANRDSNGRPTSSRTSRVTSASRCCGSAPSMHLVAANPDATFIEVGPGGVLHNMMGRAWRSARRARVDAPEGIDPREHFAATVEALRA